MSAVYSILTNKVLEMIKGGTAPWRRPWVQNGAPRSIAMAPGKGYRGCNYFLLSMVSAARGFGNNWATFNMIKERGGKIKEGQEKEHYPVFYYSGPQEDDEGNVLRRPCFLYTRVWNLDQIEGIEIPAVQTRTHEPIAECERVVNGYQNAPKIEHRGDVACYNPVFDRILMPDASAFNRASDYYATLFHEMAHSTGHESRLNRAELKTLSDKHAYSLEELVAELTAVFLCDHAGIVNAQLENSAAYLNGWFAALSKEPKMFATAASRAHRAADFILGVSE